MILGRFSIFCRDIFKVICCRFVVCVVCGKRLIMPKCFLNLQQTTLEKFLAKGEIAHNEKFLNLPQCFQLYSKIILTLTEFFHSFAWMFIKLSAAGSLYVGKGLCCWYSKNQNNFYCVWCTPKIRFRRVIREIL